MKDEIKNDMLRFLANRAPNYVREEIIIRRLDKYSSEEIKNALMELHAEGKLKKPLIPKDLEVESEASFRSHALSSYENIPIRKTIKVGDTLVPRILKTDLMETSLEDINEAVETLSEHSVSLEKRFSELFKEEIRKHWGNLIAMFGIFVAIFSFIIVALPRISFPAPYGFWPIVKAGVAQLLPVALILAIFIVVLLKLFR